MGTRRARLKIHGYTCGQSYKPPWIVIYDSRVALTRRLPIYDCRVAIYDCKFNKDYGYSGSSLNSVIEGDEQQDWPSGKLLCL